MEQGAKRPYALLLGVGLVLVGLLAGILGMLFLDRFQQGSAASPVVERVELGSRDAVRPAGSEQLLSSVNPVALNQLFRQVAGQVTASVVFIEVDIPGSGGREWFHNFDADEGERAYPDNVPRQSVGSGVIVSRQGYLVTNHHVIEGAGAVRVTLADKRQFGARIVGIDKSTDLAVLKLERAQDLPAIALGNSDELEVGEWVLAIGNPFRLNSTVTAGIVSAMGRQVDIIDDDFRIEDFIQTDAAINPGNSGGALVNLRGELVGICTAIATESGSYEGYGFAVPVSLMERVVTDLIQYGEVQRGYLGVTIQEVDARTAGRLGLREVGGVFLDDVRRGTAAFQAGLRSGDVVLAIDGRSVNAPNELLSMVARHRPGDRLDLDVWRGGGVQRFAVTLMGRDAPAYQGWLSELRREQPSADAPAPGEIDSVFELDAFGLGVRDLDADDAQAFDVAEGVYVAYVQAGSPAAAAGLPRDVVLTHVNGEAVSSLDLALLYFGRAEQGSDPLLLRVMRRDGTSAFYEMEPSA